MPTDAPSEQTAQIVLDTGPGGGEIDPVAEDFSLGPDSPAFGWFSSAA